MALYVIFTVFTMIFMLLSWLKDPGYIPKGTDKKEFLVKMKCLIAYIYIKKEIAHQI